MTREVLLKEMRESIGVKDPIEFFAKMVDVFNLLFDRIDSLKNDLRQINKRSMSANWDPRVASDLISHQVTELRANKDLYGKEIEELKKAFAEDKVTQDYKSFCQFWKDTLGYHPFLD